MTTKTTNELTRTPRGKLPVRVDFMTRGQLPQVVLLDQLSGPVPHFDEAWFTERLRVNRNLIVRVARIADLVLGYVLYEVHSWGRHLKRFTVNPAQRLSGIGSQMFDALKESSVQSTRPILYTVIPERNLGAQMFLKSQGFKAVSLRRGENGEGDLYRMRWRAASSNNTERRA